MPQMREEEEEEIDEVVAERDPEGRYFRYRDVVGKGRFKVCFKAFDTQIGIDVAWSKISASTYHLTEEQLEAVVADIQTGLDLEHPNIIKCFKCWQDGEQQCINLITELFTSGNLRQYRNLHKHLDLKAVKRMARQILKGLSYLHGMHPPVAHGDLRCDKIYVNGHNGEVKIGDLGLATLIPYRYEGSDRRPQLAMSPADDIFAFGLCMLELLTLKQLDPQHCTDVDAVLDMVPDDDARAFIGKCLGQPRPTAGELLDDPFLQLKKAGGGPSAAGAGDGQQQGAGGQQLGGQGGDASLNASSKSRQEASAREKRRTE
jgi:WNK lysine deficient protein kinase